ncbi:hypothetical protein [Pelosinus sp. IPA-1]|uniref:hypothetical protein n=1 Tax=Pelosinus sp. IPA-1 TaxID=3029569 RepID=UPI00243622F9|nr:hypothetical protein [Pelosinus sp. IPA-1]GMA99350.1 hypothetical protein PIPA1_21500 [Pelosinus sp. IPA-1]
MCTSCDETYRIFSVELITKEPVNTNMELFKEIAHRLFQNKVISNINIDNNKAYNVNGKQMFGFDLHLGNTNNPLTVNLENVEKALNGLLAQFVDYSEMQIKLN